MDDLYSFNKALSCGKGKGIKFCDFLEISLMFYFTKA